MKRHVASIHGLNNGKIIQAPTPTSQPSASGRNSAGLNSSSHCGNAFPFPPTISDSNPSLNRTPMVPSSYQIDPSSTNTKKTNSSTSTANQRYYCKFPNCTSSFAYDKDLIRHSKSHTEGKAHQCPNCKKAFSRKDALRRHVRSGLEKGNKCAGTQVGLTSRGTTDPHSINEKEKGKGKGKKRGIEETITQGVGVGDDGDEEEEELELESPRNDKTDQLELEEMIRQNQMRESRSNTHYSNQSGSTATSLPFHHQRSGSSSNLSNHSNSKSSQSYPTSGSTINNTIKNKLSHSSATLNSYVSSSPMDLISSKETLIPENGNQVNNYGSQSQFHSWRTTQPQVFYCPYPGCNSVFRLPEDLGFHAQNHPSRGRYEAEMKSRNQNQNQNHGSEFNFGSSPEKRMMNQEEGRERERERSIFYHQSSSSSSIPTSSNEISFFSGNGSGSNSNDGRFSTSRPPSSSGRNQENAFLLPPLKRFRTFSSVSSSSSSGFNSPNTTTNPYERPLSSSSSSSHQQRSRDQVFGMPSNPSDPNVNAQDDTVATDEDSNNHCKGCSRRFSRKDSLLRHWRKVKGCGNLALDGDSGDHQTMNLGPSSTAEVDGEGQEDDDELELDQLDQ